MLKISLLLFVGRVSAPATPASGVRRRDARALQRDGDQARRRVHRERSGTACPRSATSGSAIRRTAARPTFATDVQVVYDASNLYVAVRAHDPEPDRLVGLRTRRDASRRPTGCSVIVDSFHDRRTAFEFGVNPAGVKEDTRLVQRQQRRQRLGRGLGRRASRATRTAGARSSGFRSRSCASSRPTTPTFGFAVVRADQAGSTRPTRGRYISKSANGVRLVVRRSDAACQDQIAEAARARALRRRTGDTQPT